MTPTILGRPAVRAAELILHELVHIEQWRQHGTFRFAIRYSGEYLRARLAGVDGRTAYRNIGFERAAREIAASLPPLD